MQKWCSSIVCSQLVVDLNVTIQKKNGCHDLQSEHIWTPSSTSWKKTHPHRLTWLFSVIKGTLDNVIVRIKYVFPHGYSFFPIDNLNLYSFFMFGPMKHSIFHEARDFPSDFLLKTEVHRGFGGGRQPSLLWVEGAIGRACHWGEGAMSLAKRIPVWYLFFGA